MISSTFVEATRSILFRDRRILLVRPSQIVESRKNNSIACYRSFSRRLPNPRMGYLHRTTKVRRPPSRCDGTGTALSGGPRCGRRSERCAGNDKTEHESVRRETSCDECWAHRARCYQPSYIRITDVNDGNSVRLSLSFGLACGGNRNPEKPDRHQCW
jgi:hypothetical protein